MKVNIILLVLPLIIGCSYFASASGPVIATLNQETIAAADTTSPQLIEAIIRYMECDECTNGEKNFVIANKVDALPYLLKILEYGPSASKIETLKHSLGGRYDVLRNNGLVNIPKDEFVNTYVENLRALYFIRTAEVLSVIGGSEARNALILADARPDYRQDVKAAIKRALLYIQ